jgi:Rrf2 family nitric oxide-sensitive transcriptional repressor
MLSQTVEYALRAVVCLAGGCETPATTQHIAEATKVPQDYLSKVLQALGRAGLVVAQRGKHGGFVLARAADRITLLDVINAVDPIRRIRTCPLGLESHSLLLCPLHQRLDAAAESIEGVFAATKISELLEQPGLPTPLQDITGAVHV